MDLPGEVDSVEECSVHALTGLGAVSMACVTTHEYALVESVTLRDTLANGVDRVPFYTIPRDGVWLEDLNGAGLNLFRSSSLAGIPVLVG